MNKFFNKITKLYLSVIFKLMKRQTLSKKYKQKINNIKLIHKVNKGEK